MPRLRRAGDPYYTGEKIYQSRPDPDPRHALRLHRRDGPDGADLPGRDRQGRGDDARLAGRGEVQQGRDHHGDQRSRAQGPQSLCRAAATRSPRPRPPTAGWSSMSPPRTARRRARKRFPSPCWVPTARPGRSTAASRRRSSSRPPHSMPTRRSSTRAAFRAPWRASSCFPPATTQYLPRVKAYFDAFPKDVRQIGDHTWNNGYNGIACGEYYLRTGDASVLPILQHYCDDAKERQKFGCGWTHWSNDINPGYVAGGLMNPAGAQVLTTLLLGKECGVNVDEETLLGALRFFYRFAGHGTVAYGDHRGEGGLGSNGKDGMIAAAMQIATGARRRCHQLRKGPPVSGHVDDRQLPAARDGPWRRRSRRWHLARHHHLLSDEGKARPLPPVHGPAHLVARSEPRTRRQHRHRDAGLGRWRRSVPPVPAWGCPTPRRCTRCASPARRARSSRRTTRCPTNLWGTAADRAFLSIDHNPKYFEYGPEEPAHVPFYALGGAYHKPEKDLNSLPRETLLKNIYHRNYMIRTQAGKALRDGRRLRRTGETPARPRPARAACGARRPDRLQLLVRHRPQPDPDGASSRPRCWKPSRRC